VTTGQLRLHDRKPLGDGAGLLRGPAQYRVAGKKLVDLSCHLDLTVGEEIR